MPEIFAALVFLGSLLALLSPVRRVARLPLALTVSLAFTLLVSFETLLLNALSLFHTVRSPEVVTGHALLVAACIAPNPRRALASIKDELSRSWRRRRSLWMALLILPIAALALASAVRYAPNNFDAMTYHLARVAHWMQNRSVGPYPSGSYRQLALPAGSDYLLLQLQLVSRSDRLANLLQFGCYLILVCAAPTLSRLVGTPARFCWFGAVLVATLPMAALQASSAQNDLVAAVVTIAIIAASLPFLHLGRPLVRVFGRLLLLGAACGAGSLVKPTALLAASPFLAFAGISTTVRFLRQNDRVRRYVWPAAVTLALLLVLCLPELQRRNVFREAPDAARGFSYPLLAEWSDRSINSLRGVAHHLPPPRRVATWLWPALADQCAEAAALCVTTQFRPHEDLVGNPGQTAFLITAVVCAAVRGRALPRRARFAILAVLAAWLVFHATLRDNPFVPRLELPLFALCPLCLPAIVARESNGRFRSAAFVAPVGALALAAYAYFVVLRNELRPPLGPGEPYEVSYYNSFDAQREPQDAALSLMGERGCFRLGLSMGEAGYDYPITWRAMQVGASVRHVVASDSWPCLLYSDHGSPAGAATSGWMPLAGIETPAGGSLPFLFARAAAQ